MIKTIAQVCAGAGLLALQACSVGPPDVSEEVAAQEQAISSAAISFTSSSASAYCAKVTLPNALKEATPRWQAVLDLKGTKVTSMTGVKFSDIFSGRITGLPVNLDKKISAGSTTSFEFCGSSTSSSQRPTLGAFNFESNAYASCPSNSGLLPTKAALAIAMAKELGRWDALNDLTVDANYQIALSSTGLARCSNGCANVKAILGQQDPAVANFHPPQSFSPDMLRSDLYAAFDRQRNMLIDLQNNNKAALPPAHKLTLVGGPTNLGVGACGPHYVFQADHTDGTPLTSTEAANLSKQLCYFGYGCGGNEYLAFTATNTQCPSGRTCVAVNPTDGDNGSASTTTAGSAPTYPMNRVYDPANGLLATSCITTMGRLGALTSKCATSPSTCGYLYCMAQ
ncbi:MAG: hypothetical protein QM756_21775 [Polyangiaceae bacterium]